MLELYGLVIMVPRKGAQVAQITEKDLNDVLEVRLGLEELAVKLACQRITESELQKLYQASRSFEQMLETTETDDLQKLAQAEDLLLGIEKMHVARCDNGLAELLAELHDGDLSGDEQRAPDSAAEQSAGANVPLPD